MPIVALDEPNPLSCLWRPNSWPCPKASTHHARCYAISYPSLAHLILRSADISCQHSHSGKSLSHLHADRKNRRHGNERAPVDGRFAKQDRMKFFSDAGGLDMPFCARRT
ncbi:unnamed protein product [Cercospora beticola]|nr:unnamed protein product [Cercospora beticola]